MPFISHLQHHTACSCKRDACRRAAVPSWSKALPSQLRALTKAMPQRELEPKWLEPKWLEPKWLRI
eukprot:12889828-Prorocentrum_lima.AAC.1